MRKLGRQCLFVVACALFAWTSNLYGQTSSNGDPVVSSSSKSAESAGSNEFGFGVKASMLGVGAEVAAKVTHRSNVRAGFNLLGYSRGFNQDGVDYDGHLSFRTVEAHYDIFPFAGKFHISPGLLAFVGNPISARASVSPDQSFTLGGQTYYGAPSPNQTGASGKVDFNQVAPMITVGLGNLVRRDSKHFSVPVEFGVAFQGSPNTALNVSGDVCDSPSTSPPQNCRPVASDPTVQSNIVSEQAKLNHDLRYFKVYPIISIGFGYKF